LEKFNIGMDFLGGMGVVGLVGEKRVGECFSNTFVWPFLGNARWNKNHLNNN
jgi:hypothetical protein